MQIFEIDGTSVPFSFHPTTLKSNKKARPRAQLTDNHIAMLQLPTVDESSSDITKITFPNGMVNYVLLARQNSSCPSLQRLHNYIMTAKNGDKLDTILTLLKNSRFLTDDLGGGKYVVSGYGNLGRNTKRRPPTQPCMRKSLTLPEHDAIANVVGGILSCVACCVQKHCEELYIKNQKLKQINPNLQWPSLKHQCLEYSWMSSQFVLRRWGPGLSKCQGGTPQKNMIVSAHVDRGDLDTVMPSIYCTGGGVDGKGGRVSSTDLALFENETGGAGVHIKTCIRDTVVVVMSNSRRQLHGCILEESNAKHHDDLSAWSTRIIPYIPNGIYHWMLHNQKSMPAI